jgi:hypothetical protein
VDYGAFVLVPVDSFLTQRNQTARRPAVPFDDPSNKILVGDGNAHTWRFDAVDTGIAPTTSSSFFLIKDNTPSKDVFMKYRTRQCGLGETVFVKCIYKDKSRPFETIMERCVTSLKRAILIMSHFPLRKSRLLKIVVRSFSKKTIIFVVPSKEDLVGRRSLAPSNAPESPFGRYN